VARLCSTRTVQIPADAAPWRSLSADSRLKLKVNYPRRPVAPSDARAAVAWARYRRRRLKIPTTVALIAIAAVALWAVGALLFQVPFPRAVPIAGGCVFVVWAALALAWLSPGRIETDHLAAALADARHMAAPLTVTWRHGRPFRFAGASLIAMATVLFLVFTGYAATLKPEFVVNAALLAFIGGRALLIWPWPIDSPAAHLAAVDELGVTVPPLGLTIPWSRIKRVGFSRSWGLRVTWTLDDPAAVVVAAPVSPFQRRRLARWLRANNGGVTLSAGQMRESPETVYLASIAYLADAT
jgi:hypothetical protein